MSFAPIMPSPTSLSSIHARRPRQNPPPTRITGIFRLLPVCTSVRTSESSSSVPNPPGRITYAEAKRTNIILRVKK